MTHSEIVHVYYGLGSVTLGLSAAWAWRHDRGVARYAWPVLLLLAGASLLLPVETGERRYQIVGWWVTLRSVLPWSFSEWLDYARRFHVIQHKTAGLLILTTGAAELWLLQTAQPPPWVRQVTPLCSVLTGIVLGIHGGTHTHLPAVRETVHHWILAAGLVPGGIVLGLYRAGRLQSAWWKNALAIALVIIGLEWALFYRLS